MVEEYGGVVHFARLIVESGVVAGRMPKARPASHSEHKVVGPHNFYNVMLEWCGVPMTLFTRLSIWRMQRPILE